MNRGYVKVWRKIQDSGLMQMPNTLALFMHILFSATHKDIKIGTPTGIIELKRGQYISGRIKLSHDLKQSEREIRTGLSRLSELSIISIKTTNKYSVYTIENYGLYQDIDQQSDQQTTNKRPASDQQTTTKQEHNKLNTKEHNNRGSRLPTNWIAPQEYIDYCNTERPDLNANFIADGFKDYWISIAGSKGLKTDWFATWRNWVRRQSAIVSNVKPLKGHGVISDEKFKEWLEPKKEQING